MDKLHVWTSVFGCSSDFLVLWVHGMCKCFSLALIVFQPGTLSPQYQVHESSNMLAV
jgi:hypothetical protein